MSGDSGTLTTLLMIGAVVGTGGAALAAVPALAGTAAVAGGAAATAGAIGTGATIAGLSAGTLATVGAVSAAGLALSSGLQARDAAKTEKKFIEQQQVLESARFEKGNLEREKRLDAVLGAQAAAQGSRGINLGSRVAEVSIDEAAAESGVATLNNAIRKQTLTSSAQQKAAEGRAAVTGGAFRASQSLLTLA